MPGGQNIAMALSTQARLISGSPAFGWCHWVQLTSVTGENTTSAPGSGRPRSFSATASCRVRWPPAESPATASRAGSWPRTSSAWYTARASSSGAGKRCSGARR